MDCGIKTCRDANSALWDAGKSFKALVSSPCLCPEDWVETGRVESVLRRLVRSLLGVGRLFSSSASISGCVPVMNLVNETRDELLGT
jgi:hypothetical protein